MMRMSFGSNGGGRMGGGGGGGMLRTVQRAVRAGVGGGAAQEPFSHSTTTTNTNSSSSTSSSRQHTYKPPTSNILSLSSSTSSSSYSFNLPLSATSTLPTWPSSPVGSEDFEWECVDYGSEWESGLGFYDDFVFGSAPSNGEVQHAVSSLQQVLDPASFSQLIKDRHAYNSDKDVADEIKSPTSLVNNVSSVGTEVDWIEPSLQLCSPRMLQPYGSDRVYDAFHLLQTEPCIQRMVVSLSSDKAVWDAVLNNEVVRELKESLSEADKSVRENLDDSSDGSSAAMNILSWIFDNTKAKVMELMEKITKLVNELFQPQEDEKTTRGEPDAFEEKLRASFLLSIVVLLIVVVGRAHRA